MTLGGAMGKCKELKDVKCCDNPKIHEGLNDGWDVCEECEEDQYICKNCGKIVCHVHPIIDESYWTWPDDKKEPTCKGCKQRWSETCCGDPCICGKFPNEYTKKVEEDTKRLDVMMLKALEGKD